MSIFIIGDISEAEILNNEEITLIPEPTSGPTSRSDPESPIILNPSTQTEPLTQPETSTQITEPTSPRPGPSTLSYQTGQLESDIDSELDLTIPRKKRKMTIPQIKRKIYLKKLELVEKKIEQKKELHELGVKIRNLQILNILKND